MRSHTLHYIDEIIIFHDQMSMVHEIILRIKELLQEANLPINYEKSNLNPRLQKTILGYNWQPKKVNAEETKISKLRQLWKDFKDNRTDKKLALIKGHLCYLFPLAGNFLRLHQLFNSTSIKEDKINEIMNSNLDNEAITPFSSEAWDLYTDASDSGFGSGESFTSPHSRT
eukprot:GHVP01030414.1.p1 GENE.GHVP01030414.1~~GHVP01030414.1.p1  ORF type:complete len:171 (-),score=22.17 GHVP01030414.1:389-901(-)